ncbi:hypothetical protein N7486_003945 [Penicillium sp. IBT 16267x]|nr:hypothetical protein N7486_003945 [Penicillium sp. IBT 16267x]
MAMEDSHSNPNLNAIKTGFRPLDRDSNLSDPARTYSQRGWWISPVFHANGFCYLRRTDC